MKVDYDSRGKSLLFEFSESGGWDDTEDVAGGVCLVGLDGDRPTNIQLLGAEENIGALDEAAERYELDGEGLKAAACAAFAAPDREILIEVGRRLPLSEEEEEAKRARAA